MTYLKDGSLVEGVTTTAASSGTLTLTASSSTHQQITGTLAHSVVLPNATTLPVGRRFTIMNRSTFPITVKYNDASPISPMVSDFQRDFILINNGTSNGTWDVSTGSSGAGGGLSSWIAGTVYPTGTVITYSKNIYICIAVHTADTTFEPDYTLGYWALTNIPAIGKNYIGTGSNFEDNDIGGWLVRHSTLDTTSKMPNQASGSWSAASANLTFVSTATGPLSGLYSGKLDMATSATVAGDMLVSQVFPVDICDQAKILSFKIKYSCTANSANGNFSGTSSNSFGVAIYDVTNSTWLDPAGRYNIVQSSGVGEATGTFQTSSNGTQYRIAVYFPNASAGIITLLVDDFYLGPQVTTTGILPKASTVQTFLSGSGTYTLPTTYPITHIKVTMVGGGGGGSGSGTASGTAGGAGGNSTFGTSLLAANGGNGASAVVGSGGVGGSASLGSGPTGSATSGGSGGAGGTVTGTGFYASAGNGGPSALGGAGVTSWNAAGGNGATNTGGGGGGGYGPSNAAQTYGGNGGGAGGYIDAIIVTPAASYSYNVGTAGTAGSAGANGVAGGTGGSGMIIVEEFYLGVNVVMSSDTDTRVVAMYTTNGGGTSITTNLTALSTGWATGQDTHGGFNASTGVYTIPVAGWYDFGGRLEITSPVGTYGNLLKIDGGGLGFFGNYVSSDRVSSGSFRYFLAKQTIQLGVYSSSASGTVGYGDFWVKRASGPATIAASESVNASIGLTAAVSPTANSIIIYDTVVFDSHGGYSASTGLYTAPISGKYRISVNALNGTTSNLYLKVNGAAQGVFMTALAGAAYSGTFSYALNAGDTIGIYVDTTSTYTAKSGAVGYYNRLSIERVGN